MSRLDTVSKVLKLKDHRKEGLEAQVRRVRDLILQEEKRLEDLHLALKKAVDEYEQKHLSPRVSAEELRLFSDYFAEIYDHMDAQKKAVLARLAELDGVRAELIEAHQEKELMEKLRGRIVREETAEREKAAQKEMDFQHLVRRGRHDRHG